MLLTRHPRVARVVTMESNTRSNPLSNIRSPTANDIFSRCACQAGRSGFFISSCENCCLANMEFTMSLPRFCCAIIESIGFGCVPNMPAPEQPDTIAAAATPTIHTRIFITGGSLRTGWSGRSSP
ncbi:MAG TPA: hypothetical protein DDX05_02815 [Deltaproteobacteria bacterium]|nr:hypothetical protein [Deltaproteobacteria bacterium]